MSRWEFFWGNASMDRLFRSLKSEWVPATGYQNMGDAQQSIAENLIGITAI